MIVRSLGVAGTTPQGPASPTPPDELPLLDCDEPELPLLDCDEAELPLLLPPLLLEPVEPLEVEASAVVLLPLEVPPVAVPLPPSEHCSAEQPSASGPGNRQPAKGKASASAPSIARTLRKGMVARSYGQSCGVSVAAQARVGAQAPTSHSAARYCLPPVLQVQQMGMQSRSLLQALPAAPVPVK